MSDSPNGPPLLRPVPVRPFNLNLREPTPPDEHSLPHTPEYAGSTLNLDSLNFKLLDRRNRVRSDSNTISRAQSVQNLTSSTLMGIYEPTTYGSDKFYSAGDDLNTPWGTGAETPAKGLSMDEPNYFIQKERAYPARRRSSLQPPAHIQPLSTTTSLFYSSLRALLLSGLGVLYGIGVATVQDSRTSVAFRMEHMIKAASYDWGYLAFWGASGLILGCLLPWFDGIWESAFGQGSNENAMETSAEYTPGSDGVAKDQRRNTDWALAVRGIGMFIGIAFAI
ncbi:hypothetical protein F5Y19DRAFT_436762, partial [Xylariaceae sp. FL1651]